MSKPRKISVEPVDMPCCPLCDHGMQQGEEPVEIVSTNGGTLALAHTWCVDDLNDKEPAA